MSFVPYEQLRANFGKALAFGIAGTGFSVYFDLSPLLIMAPPILAMVLYFLWYRDKSKLDSQVEQFADSFYYLGFLFTLAALSIALIPWATNSELITPESVISKLGIALLTTIFGLGGRVYLTQFRVSEEEAIADIQRKLRDGSRSLAAELDLINEKFRSIAEESTSQLERMVESSTIGFEEAIAEARESVSKSLAEFNDSVGRLGEKLNLVSPLLVEFQENFAKANKAVSADLNGIAGLSDRLAALDKTLGKVSTDLGTLSKMRENVDDLSESMDRMKVIVVTIGAELGEISNKLAEAGRIAVRSATEMSSRNAEYDAAVIESVADIKKTQKGLEDAFKIATHNINNET